MSLSLTKEERLSGKADIETLMTGGKWISQPHISCCHMAFGDCGFNRIMVSVPKKHFKRAVKRNLLKRRIRESYRLNKNALEAKGLNLLFYYNSKDIVDSATITDEILEILKTISK